MAKPENKDGGMEWVFGSKNDPVDQVSSYNNEFQKPNRARREPFKPDHHYQAPQESIQTETTAKASYIGHQVGRPSRHQPDRYIKPDGEMDVRTSYSQDFIEQKGKRPNAIINAGMRKEPAIFEGNPTYKADFQGTWDIQRREPIVHKGAYVASGDAFAGNSTYAGDFQKNSAHKARPAIIPDSNTKVSTDPFDDRTGYRADFIQHPMPERFPKHREEFKANKNPLDSMTTTKLDFTPKQACEPTKSFKPEHHTSGSNEPFNGETTQKTSFQGHPAAKISRHQPDRYVQPDGEMDVRTSYSHDFIGRTQARAAPIKPAHRKPTEAKFEGDSTYTGDFRNLQGGEGRRAPLKTQEGYVPSTAPFEGLSTYTGHFPGHTQRPTVSFKPEGAALKSDQPFETATVYKSEFGAPNKAPFPQKTAAN